LELIWVDDLQVLQAQGRIPWNPGPGRSENSRRIFSARSNHPLDVEQGGVERRCTLSLGLAEQTVPGAQRQSVRFTNGCHSDDRDGNVQIGHEAANDGQLLSVFLAEVRAIWLHDLEKLHDDRGDAREVPGPILAAQAIGEPVDPKRA
jgi:hypothetical protein